MIAVTVVGGAMMAIGAFLPWATASTGFGSLSVSGMEGDGIFLLVTGGIAVAAALMSAYSTGPWWAVVAVVSVIGAVTCFIDLQNVHGAFDYRNVVVQVGVGLWVCLAGSVVGLLGSLAIGWLRWSSAEPSAPASSASHASSVPRSPSRREAPVWSLRAGRHRERAPVPSDFVIAWDESLDSKRPTTGPDGRAPIRRTYDGSSAADCIDAMVRDELAAGKYRVVEAVWPESLERTLSAAFGEPERTYSLVWPGYPRVRWTSAYSAEAPTAVPSLTTSGPSGSIGAPQGEADEPPTTVTPPTADAGDQPTKVCPDCAETVLRDARICRYCRYVFESEMAPASEPPPTSSVDGAEAATPEPISEPPSPPPPLRQPQASSSEPRYPSAESRPAPPPPPPPAQPAPPSWQPPPPAPPGWQPPPSQPPPPCQPWQQPSGERPAQGPPMPPGGRPPERPT